jgi:hypothetical protein
VFLTTANWDANETELQVHYTRHRTDFTVASEKEYERLVDYFLSGTPRRSMMQCKRTQGDIVRYDVTTTEYGVLSATGIIRTYFKAKPCASLPPGVPKVRCHAYHILIICSIFKRCAGNGKSLSSLRLFNAVSSCRLPSSVPHVVQSLATMMLEGLIQN